MKLRSCFRGDEYGVSSVVFDPQEELLWAATFGVNLSRCMQGVRSWPTGSRNVLPRLRYGDVYLSTGSQLRHQAVGVDSSWCSVSG